VLLELCKGLLTSRVVTTTGRAEVPPHPRPSPAGRPPHTQQTGTCKAGGDRIHTATVCDFFMDCPSLPPTLTPKTQQSLPLWWGDFQRWPRKRRYPPRQTDKRRQGPVLQAPGTRLLRTYLRRGQEEPNNAAAKEPASRLSRALQSLHIGREGPLSGRIWRQNNEPTSHLHGSANSCQLARRRGTATRRSGMHLSRAARRELNTNGNPFVMHAWAKQAGEGTRLEAPWLIGPPCFSAERS